MNPQQNPAEVLSTNQEMPIKVLNGSPGYINLLDALNAWQLVKELKDALSLPAAASFKHVSPVGAAVGLALSLEEAKACMTDDLPASMLPRPPSLVAAYARARGASRMSSAGSGDFIALSECCDETTARAIARDVSDGIVAPHYDRRALEVLAKKKTGNYVVLKVDPAFMPSETEERTVFGLKLRQKRNMATINASLFANIVSETKTLPPSAVTDLIVATIALKYTQGNSVCYAKNGQVIGIGVGQQSSAQCIRLAGERTINWWLHQHPKATALKFKPSVKRIDRAAAVDAYLSASRGTDTADQSETSEWMDRFDTMPPPLTEDDKHAWLNELTDVALSSDAFVPLSDFVDNTKQLGVKYIAVPGDTTSSQQQRSHDALIVKACNDAALVLVHTGVRLFQHH